MYFKIKTLSLIILLQVLSLHPFLAQHKTAQIDKLMTMYHENGNFNGSLLVAENGKVIYQNGFGMANMEWNIGNQWDTKHRLGSISKQFTAMLIMQLVEDDQLQLDVPITKYLPDYPSATGDKITIHHLLTHSSGIPNYTMLPNFIKEMSRNSYTPVEFVETFAHLPLQFEPGEKFSYCNSDYFLLGRLIEKITEKSYEQVLKDKILTPLNMKNTGYDHQDLILKNRASGYEKHGHGYKNAEYLDMSIPYAAGSLYSTVMDLHLWDKALYTNKLLSDENMKLVFTPHIPAWGHSYGYGWTIRTTKTNEKEKEPTTVVGHSGVINGFNTLISRNPSDKNLIVLLNNTGLTILEDIARDIYNILEEKHYNVPKKSLANTLLSDIHQQGITAALEHFESNKQSNNYMLSEAEMNTMGYQLLYYGETDHAIAVFKLNVAEFPKSWNVYDSLGEAYIKKGDVTLAIKNYKKSIAINPQNKGGIEILKKLEDI